MNLVDGFFRSPSDQVSAFADAQLRLYRHDPSLQDYFMMLQLDRLSGARANYSPLSASDRLIGKAIRTTDKLNLFRGRPRVKADVLFCPMPDFARKTETQFLIRTLIGLAQTGATILCLLPDHAPCRSELDMQLAAIGRSGQVTFVDPSAPLNRTDARLRTMVSKVRAHKAFEETLGILEPCGMSPGQEVKNHYQYIASHVEAWERLAEWVEFDRAVVRCHWHALCSAVARTALRRGKPVVTFQQGVITHTLDVPVTASTYVAFGHSSARFLEQMNRRFCEAAEVPEPPVQYVTGGSLYDTVGLLPDQFDNQSLLLVDVPQPKGQGDFYGVEAQCEALIDLAEKLLSTDTPLRRLIIRPHPYWNNLDLEVCQRLARRYGSRCELSHPSWPLEYDLSRSSVVAGIFSGVLTVSSACGLPSIFLQTEYGYTTGDLDCFSAGQTLRPDAAFREIREILSDREAYSRARSMALRNAAEYYANGTNIDLSGAFFEKLFRSRCAGEQTQYLIAAKEGQAQAS
jgi:hypothetical protein